MELVTSRPVIGVISVDNYDDLENETSESDISHIIVLLRIMSQSLLENIKCSLAEWLWIVFYLFTDYTVLGAIDVG